MRDIVHGVLEDLVPVGALDQAREQGADLALPGRRHFVVVHFDRHALLFECEAHRGADVLQRVHRRHREITALHRGPVAHVAAFHVFAGRPRRLGRLHAHRSAGHVDAPFHRIKYEKFRLRSEESGVADARRLQVSLGALGDRTRVAVVALAVGRFDHVAGQDQRRFIGERIHARAARVGHQQHVGGLDAFPAGNRRTVKGMAVGKFVVSENLGRHGYMLFLAPGIGKPQVNELDFVVLEHFHDIGSASHLTLLTIKGI